MSERLRELEGLEYQRDVAKVKVEFAARVAKLLNNPDFKAVILEEYIIQEAARFVQQSCEPMYTKEQREDALAMAQSAGHLKRWLTATQQQAEQISARIPEMEEAIEELRAQSDEDFDATE